jgi:hypothetical protein
MKSKINALKTHFPTSLGRFPKWLGTHYSARNEICLWMV